MKARTKVGLTFALGVEFLSGCGGDGDTTGFDSATPQPDKTEYTVVIEDYAFEPDHVMVDAETSARLVLVNHDQVGHLIGVVATDAVGGPHTKHKASGEAEGSANAGDGVFVPAGEEVELPIGVFADGEMKNLACYSGGPEHDAMAGTIMAGPMT